MAARSVFSRPPLSRPSKRFKSCKVRVHTVTTSGKRTARNVNLKVSCQTKRTTGIGLHDEIVSSPSRPSSEHVHEAQLETDPSDLRQDEPSASSYQKRREREYESWQEIRKSLLYGRIEEEAFSNDEKCRECGVEFAEIRCVDCGHDQHLCISCAKKTHQERNYFHVLERFKDGCLLPYFPNHMVIARSHQRNCPSAQFRNVICIDQHGRQHQKQILFCDCEKDAVTLVKLMLWPGSIARPNIAFHFKLMELAETLLLECHISLRKFCDALGVITKSSILPKWVKNMYSTLNSDSFDEFRYHQYLLRNGIPFIEEVKAKSCPLCPKLGETGTIIESMDGCFGLVRKKSSGKSSCPPRHSMTLFADQNNVDEFVDNYTSSAKQAETDCHEFKAGEVTNFIRSKGKNKLYDEKGVFGRVCRHDYPKGFTNIKHGERIAYSVYELQRLLSNSSQNTCIHVMYDIACTLTSHLKKNERQDILGRVGFAIPIFHCYGHKSSCQVQFSPRRQKGYGMTDGEGIERLWSFLRGFSSMTKEMNTGRRTDILTDALLHYSARQLQQFGPTLLSKLKRCPTLINTTLLQLEELFSKLPVLYDSGLVGKWMDEEEKLIQAKNAKKSVTLTWEQKYVQNLLHLYQLRAQVAYIQEGDHSQLTDVVKKSKKVLKAVKNTEKRQKLSQRWKTGERKFNAAALSLETKRHDVVKETTYSLAVERMFLISLKNKYADGQAIAIKLSKQITQRTNGIKAAVTKYNSSLSSLEDWVEGLPAELQFDLAKDPGSQLYSHLNCQPSNDDTPFTVKRAAIDLHNFLERCKEEQELLLLEVERLINFYVGRKEELESYLVEHSGDQPKLIRGLIVIVRKEVNEINNMLCSLGSMLFEYLTAESIQKIPNAKIESEHASCELDIMDIFEVTSTEDNDEHESDLLEFSDDDSDCDHDDIK